MAVKTIETTTVIDARPDLVWSVITDFPHYAEWNPFITALEGELRLGGRLRATFSLPGSKPRTFTPKVIAYEPGRRLTWLGRLAIPRLFDGEHEFKVEPSGKGTRFTHGERFRGVLVPFTRSVLTATHEAFTAMDKALAERAAWLARY
jgi:hypothetical protein